MTTNTQLRAMYERSGLTQAGFAQALADRLDAIGYPVKPGTVIQWLKRDGDKSQRTPPQLAVNEARSIAASR